MKKDLILEALEMYLPEDGTRSSTGALCSYRCTKPSKADACAAHCAIGAILRHSGDYNETWEGWRMTGGVARLVDTYPQVEETLDKYGLNFRSASVLQHHHDTCERADHLINQFRELLKDEPQTSADVSLQPDV